jgi:hypothetical protein
MFTRRQIVTQGAVGAIAASALSSATTSLRAEAAEAADDVPSPQDNVEVVRELRNINSSVRSMPSTFETNSLAYGYVPKLRALFSTFVLSNQKFPDFCEAGMGVFYDMYDWHVKNMQPLQVGRMPDNKLTIRFMYTTLIIRQDVEPGYLGQPFDRP